MLEIKIPTAVAALMVNEHGFVAAVQRRENSAWLGFPGGKIDSGESPQCAIVREVREETSIMPKKLVPAFAGRGREESVNWCQGFVSMHVYSVSILPRPGEPPGAWVNPCDLLCPPFERYNAELFKFMVRHLISVMDGPVRAAMLKLVGHLNKGTKLL